MSAETPTNDAAHAGPAPFTGGKGLMIGGAVAGVVGLVATFAGGLERGMPSYLVAFMFVVGVAVGALCWLAIFHASAGQWMTLLRRQMEHLSTFLWAAVVLFIPIWLFRDKLYIWTYFEHGKVAPAPLAAKMTDEFIKQMGEAHSGKAIWLSSTGFLLRGLGALAFMGLCAWLFTRWSVDQDSRAPDPAVRQKMKVFASAMLVPIGLALTVLATDCIMTLEPEWYSAIIGGHYFAGSFLTAWAVLALTTALPSNPAHHSGQASAHHLHNIGKMMLAFVAFWAYLSYSQLLIIYHANMPEETPWYFARGIAGLSEFTSAVGSDPVAAKWFPMVMFLVFGHFLLPFVLLLPAPWKQNRKYIAVLATWILFAHFLDVYFWVMPAMRLLHDDMAAPNPGWQDFTAILGMSGVAVAFVVWRMRGRHAVPVNDPTLDYSLNYINPL